MAGARRPTVLVAEDDGPTRRFLCDLLEDAGYAVTAVGDGVAALERLRRAPPDAIVLDVMMPRLDGLGVLAEMRSRPATRDIPVVVVSARTDEASTWDGWRAGCDAYLTKPFEPAMLIAWLGRLLEGSFLTLLPQK